MRIAVAFLIYALPILASVPHGPGSRGFLAAEAQSDRLDPRDAFEAARTLGTPDAWEAFLKSYPDGVYADLARAYLKRPGAGGAGGRDAGRAEGGDPPPAAGAGPAAGAASVTAASEGPDAPAVRRGASFMGTPERFNRYYTDRDWKPARTLWAAPSGGGDGSRRDAPMSAREAVAAVRPGTMVRFTPGRYEGCFEVPKERSGTYEQPVVLVAERTPAGAPGASIACCTTGRAACFNLEAADHVAIDGFELVGGRYGVRVVGAGYPASEHSKGVAVLSSRGRGQSHDPFFSGQADWAVWEGNVGSGAGKGDGHGLYISNGSDWNIVRRNELFGNVSADFQVNADPRSTCEEEGIAYDDPRCDGVAGTGEGGRGASDFFLIEGNFFHHGQPPSGSGANFTSLRRSLIRNNIFGFHPRHGASFWQETDNPKLGARGNTIVNNLFVTTGRHAVQFIAHSGANAFVGNVLVGVTIDGRAISANPRAVLMEVDETVADNLYRDNFYAAGTIVGRTPSASETAVPNFSPDWFVRFPALVTHDPKAFAPTRAAPFARRAARHPDAPADLAGKPRGERTAAGPLEP